MGFNTKKVKKSKAPREELYEDPSGGSFNTRDTLATKLLTTNDTKVAHEWSKQQLALYKAGAETSESIVVEALAGSGKTTSVIELTRYLKGKVLLCAFNKRIADELKIRIEASGIPTEVHTSTLHGLGLRLIQRLQPGTGVDNMRGLGLALEALKAVGGPLSKNYQWIVKDTASICKEVAPFLKINQGEVIAQIGYSFGHFDRLDPRFLEVTCDAVFDSMRRSLEPTGSVDFSDMLYVPLHRVASGGEYDVVIVDEAQDMNRAQLALAQQVLKEHGRLIVVGDRHQAIYGFRGADKGSMDRLKDAFKAKVLPLSVTYRCPSSVVAVAQKFVPALESAPSAPVGIVSYQGYEYLANKAVAGCFILSRLNAPLLRLALSFIKEGRPAIVEGRDIAKGLINIINKLTYASPNFPLGQFLDALRVWTITNSKKAEAMDDKERASAVSDQAEALTILAEGCHSMAQLRQHIESMFEDTNGKANKIILSTVHKVKGLESNVVFILCDTFKGSWDGGEGEEANLKYVAITRSKHELVFINHPNPPKERTDGKKDIRKTEGGAQASGSEPVGGSVPPEGAPAGSQSGTDKA